MAEEQQQQSKGIGELFVEFGAKGLPTLLKGLNTVSASFLLGKNAANQFVQTLTQPAKEAGKTAVEIGKMSNALGISYKEYMRLRQYIKSHSLSEGLIDDIAKLQKVFQDFNSGIGSIPGELSIALERSGHNITEYSGDFESILRLIKDIESGTQGTDKNYRNQTLRMAGLSPEWGYAFDRGFDISKYTTVSDNEVEALIKNEEAMANLGASIEQLKMHLVEKLSPAIITVSDFLREYVDQGAAGAYDKAVTQAVKTTKTAGGIAAQGFLSTPIGAPLRVSKDLSGIFKNLGEQMKTQGQPTGGAAPVVPPSMQGTAHIPPNLSNMITTININNENKVNVANPQDAGKAIGSISNETLQNIDYNQFQLSNQTGI